MFREEQFVSFLERRSAPFRKTSGCGTERENRRYFVDYWAFLIIAPKGMGTR
jgi:hypothetical protein